MVNEDGRGLSQHDAEVLAGAQTLELRDCICCQERTWHRGVPMEINYRLPIVDAGYAICVHCATPALHKTGN